MKLTKRGFGSYFDALQFSYAISTLSWNKDEKLKKIFHSLRVSYILLKTRVNFTIRENIIVILKR